MPAPAHIVSLSAIGPDSPGLVSRITNRVLRLEGNILDVEESCRRGIFSIFLVVDFSASDQTPEAIQESLNGIEEETGLKVIVRGSDEIDIVATAAGDHLLVTILGTDRPGIIAEISSLFHSYKANIEGCRMIARGPFFSMEMAVTVNSINAEAGPSRAVAIERMKEELKSLCARLGQSVVIQSESTYRQAKKIVVFDVESCLIEESSVRRFLDALNERLNTLERRIGPLSHEATGGWAQALVDHVGVFQGIPMQDLEAAGPNLKLHTGVLELLRILKAMGYKVALLSTGFDCFLKWIYEAESVDYAFCNTLQKDDKGNAAGVLEEPVLTASTKIEILEFIMSMEGISRDQVVAVGDGSTYSRFMKDAGLSIACSPEAGNLSTDGVFSSDHMLNILYCLGITQEDIARYRENSEV